MKKSDVVVGNEYLAKVSGTLQRVRVTRAYDTTARVYPKYVGLKGYDSFRRVTRWEAKSLATGRTIVIKSAQRLRPIRELGEEAGALLSE